MVAQQKDEARVYLRRSETKQEMSLHDQLRIALGRAAELGVSIQATSADIDYMQANGLLRYKDLYLDDGLKGDDLERPAFKQMCDELLSSDTVGWLFCARRDRLGRPQNIGSFRMAITEADFAENGITLVFSDQIITPADMERDYFNRMITSSVECKGAGDFLAQHAERVITAQQRLAREGWWTGGKPLYGFGRSRG